MPNCDGLTATRRIRAWEQQRQQGHEAPGRAAAAAYIAGLSALAGDCDTADGISAGMDEFLTKPVTPTAVREALARYWRRRGAAAQ